jgi:hypothetical protein
MQWTRLLAFALERADTFECAVPYPVIVQDLSAAPLWPRELEPLRPALVDRHVSLVRWDLVQDYPTQYLRFRLAAPVASYVRSLPRLETWSWQLGTPEDPTFFEDGTPLLSTESVDGRISVYAEPADVAALTGVGIRLVESLGVKPEPWPTP